MRRQVGDEADRVGEDDAPAAPQPHLAHGRVERGEHLLLGEHVRAGDAVEQRRLAGVRVADDGDDRIGHAAAPLAVQLARPHDDLQLLADGGDALVDHAPVELDLRLARAAEEAVAAALALQVRPRAHEPALLVGEVRELDLQPPLLGVRALAEDLQDEPGAVEHLDVPRPLQVALLDGRDGMIDDDEGDVAGGDQRLELLDLAGAEQGCRARVPPR